MANGGSIPNVPFHRLDRRRHFDEFSAHRPARFTELGRVFDACRNRDFLGQLVCLELDGHQCAWRHHANRRRRIHRGMDYGYHRGVKGIVMIRRKLPAWQMQAAFFIGKNISTAQKNGNFSRLR